MDWIGLAQDRDRWRTLVSEIMNLRVPWNVGNFLTSCKPVSFSRRTLHHGVSKYTCWHRCSWTAWTVEKTPSTSDMCSYCANREHDASLKSAQKALNESSEPPQSAYPIGNLSYVTVQHVTLDQVRRRFIHNRLLGLFPGKMGRVISNKLRKGVTEMDSKEHQFI